MAHKVLVSYAWRCLELDCHAFGIGFRSQTEAGEEAEHHHQLRHAEPAELILLPTPVKKKRRRR